MITIETFYNKITNMFGDKLDVILSQGIKIVLLIILAIISSAILRSVLNKLINKKGNSKSQIAAFNLFKTIALIALKVLFLVWISDLLGFSLTSLFTLLGATALALGIALKEDFQNFSAGIKIIILIKDITVGDKISFLLRTNGPLSDGQVKGELIKICLTYSILKDGNKILYVPNSQLFQYVLIKDI